MVTKGYRKGVYDRLPWELRCLAALVCKNRAGTPAALGGPHTLLGGRLTYARAVAANRSNDNNSSRGFGSLRRTFQTMMLIDSILRAGEPANESVAQASV